MIGEAIQRTSDLDMDVFTKYAGVSIPRHVSYPMPSWWDVVHADEATAMLRESDQTRQPNDLSIYLHVPYCEALCKFCACQRSVRRRDLTETTERVEAYVEAMIRELRRLGGMVSGDRKLRQVHWGGGTPTYLGETGIERVHLAMREAFNLADDAEVSIEIDPRLTTENMLTRLRRLAFNRVSMGVQDFNQEVQEHVRRVQPLKMVRDMIDTCRRLEFDAVNFDLIYGMPYQTPDTIRDTVEKTIELSPDRIAYYHYAQIPEKIATQRGMDYTKLPDSATKLEMFRIGLNLFTAAGYELIGLDHFAKPNDGLAIAARDGTLQRNFQGMTTGQGLDMLGIGATSIGHLSGIGFLQNVKETDRYVERLQSDRTVFEKAKRFSFDDRVRQALINHLYCYGEIKKHDIERRFDIDFDDYFSRELRIIEELERDGLVTIEPAGDIRVTCPLGRVLLRTVAAVFDAYLHPEAYRIGEQACFSANA